jgi:hypothetical protein
MAPFEPSWRLKLKRADHHLVALESLVGDGGFRAHEAQTPDGSWTYTIWADDVDPMVPLVLGDLLFNVRSALDHLAVALSPRGRQGKAQFPIFDLDPETDPNLASQWERQTRGIAEPVMEVMRRVQPFATESPRHHLHSLGLLHNWQNADKHRSLLVTAAAMKITKMTAHVVGSGEPAEVGAFPDDPQVLGKSGGVVISGPDRIEITEIVGTRSVVAYDVLSPQTSEDPVYNVISTCDLLIESVVSTVLAPLEPLVPEDRWASA